MTARLEEIFAKASLHLDEASRNQYLQDACQGDVELERTIQELLKASDEAGDFLARAPLHFTTESPDFPFLQPPQQPGDLGGLANYRILELVGRGGMGIVFRALDPKLQRVVAIKVLAPELARDSIARQRFEREARAAAAVSHPHIIVIHSVHEEHTPPFLVMEFIEGRTLAEKVDREGALQVEEILRIGAQIADALAAFHKVGLIHRDLKPGNILLENGVERVKVADFGLARALDDVGLTLPGIVAGTPQFMSPEQAAGEPLDGRSDLFSLGSILYVASTGRLPFQADSVPALLKKICEQEPVPIPRRNPRIPNELSKIISRLLAKSPKDRFRSAEEVAARLNDLLVKWPAQYRIRSHSQRRALRWRFWLFFALLVAGSIVTLVAAFRSPPPSPSPLPKETLESEPPPTKPTEPVPSPTQSHAGSLQFPINGKPIAWTYARDTGWNVGPQRGRLWDQGAVRIHPEKRRQFLIDRGSDTLFCTRITDDIYTETTFGDVRVQVDFLIPEGSNSGVFLMGEYELNIKDDDNSGEIVRGPRPNVVARRPAGEWQNFDILFRAPRFHPGGRKIADACFVEVLYNGILIHKNVVLKDVTTDPSMLTGKESARGPLLLQGSFGPVAFRNLRITPLQLDADRQCAEWAIRNGGMVNVRYKGEMIRGVTSAEKLPQGEFLLGRAEFHNVVLHASDMSHFAAVPTIWAIVLDGAPIGDSGLQTLGGLSELSELQLWRGEIGDEGLKHLQQMHRLKHLGLYGNPRITDTGMESVARCTSLRELDLNGTSITNIGLQKLRPLENLEWLNVMATKIDNRGLEHLVGLPKLRRLLLSYNRLTDGGMPTVAKLHGLELLELNSTEIGNEGIAPLVELKQLAYLGLAGTRVDDGIGAVLRKMKSLRTLTLSGTRVGRSTLEQLHFLPNLSELHLNETAVGDTDVETIGQLKTLKLLHIERTKISQTGFEKLKSSLPNATIHWKK